MCRRALVCCSCCPAAAAAARRGAASRRFGKDGRVFAEYRRQGAAKLFQRRAEAPLSEILMVDEAGVVDMYMPRLDSHFACGTHVARRRARWVVQREPQLDRAVVLLLVVEHWDGAVEHNQGAVCPIIFGQIVHSRCEAAKLRNDVGHIGGEARHVVVSANGLSSVASRVRHRQRTWSATLFKHGNRHCVDT